MSAFGRKAGIDEYRLLAV